MNAFQFKNFTLFHSKSSQKIGTDSVLLGAYSARLSYHKVLDVGCGCGILTFMLAQHSNAKIIGIDIHKESVEESIQNLKNYPNPEHISFYHEFFQKKAFKHQEDFDLIISNPPYFIESLKSPIESRSIARHADHYLTFEDFAESSHYYLSKNGLISLILPVNEMREMTICLSKYSIFPYHEISIIPNPNKKANRIIRFFRRNFPTSLEKEELVIRNLNNSYSDEYRKLTDAFLLDK